MTIIQSRLNRNSEAELLRFVFAVMVFLSHMHILPNGALAVDFFFLLTGYLTVSSIHRFNRAGMPLRNTFSFIIHKIKSFYPELLTATFISIIIYFIAYPISTPLLLGAVKTTINGIVPILKMTGLGVSCSDFNGATWYISSMLIGLIVVYPLFVRWFAHPLFFITGVFLCGFLCLYHGKLNYVYTFIGFTYEGNIRAVGELLMGGAAYRAIQVFSKVELTFFSALLVTLIKYSATFVIILASMMNRTTFHGIALCAELVLLISVFSGKCIDGKFYRNRLFCFLGALSIPLYLSHRAITACSDRLMPCENCSLFQQGVICFVYSIVAALIVMVVGLFIRQNSAKIKKVFIRKWANG